MKSNFGADIRPSTEFDISLWAGCLSEVKNIFPVQAVSPLNNKKINKRIITTKALSNSKI